MTQDDKCKSIDKTLEILRDIFGSNNQELIDSAIRFLKEEEDREAVVIMEGEAVTIRNQSHNQSQNLSRNQNQILEKVYLKSLLSVNFLLFSSYPFYRELKPYYMHTLFFRYINLTKEMEQPTLSLACLANRHSQCVGSHTHKIDCQCNCHLRK
jgi:hypothetical protein